MAKNDYLVIGMGRFGQAVAEQLHEMGKNVAVVDKDPVVVDRFGKKYDFAVTADSTDIDTLKDLGVQYIPTIIVALSDVNASVLTAAALRELGHTSIFIKARDQTHKRILNAMGLSNVVIPEVEVAQRMALRAIFKFGIDVTSFDDKLSIVKVSVDERNAVGKKLSDLNLRRGHKINLMAIQRGKETITPEPNQLLEIGDTVVFLCENDSIKAAVRVFHKEMKGS